MKINSNALTTLCLIATTLTAHAATGLKLLPLNCNLKQVRLTDKTIMLNATGKKYSPIYFIKNNSNTMLILDHTKKNVGASAGWSSMLKPGNWSAITVTQKQFTLQCSSTSKTGTNPVGCAALKVCQPEASLSIKQSGDYWIAEDKTFNELAEALYQRGTRSTPFSE